MEFVNMNIGKVLKERRISLGVKQEDIAEQMNVTVQTIYKWEKGQTEPKASQVSQLADILKLTEKEICRGEMKSQKFEPFEFVRRVGVLMSEVPHTELLVGMQKYIDDEEGFIKMLAKVSEYPYELFEESHKNHAQQMITWAQEGAINFKSDEEKEKFLELQNEVIKGNIKSM